MVTKEELAWAAGLFDGEGYLCTYQSRNGRGGGPYPAMRLGVKMTDFHSVRRFAEVWGLKLNGPYTRKNPRAKPVLTAVAHSQKDIRRVVESMWPYLGLAKRRQALTAFAKYALGRGEASRKLATAAVLKTAEP